MNLATGSWTRFALGILLAPWSLLLLLFGFMCAVNLFHPSDVISGIPFSLAMSSYASRLFSHWAYLTVPLLLTALILRRWGMTRTRHHVLGSMVATIVMVGGLILIEQSIAAETPEGGMQAASAPDVVAEVMEFPCGGGPSTLFTSLSLLLLLTVPSLVFSRIAYGDQAGQISEPGWRVAGWIYVGSLIIGTIFLFLSEFGIMSSHGEWC